MSWNGKSGRRFSGRFLYSGDEGSLDHVGIARCLSVPVVNIATAPDTVNFVRRAPRHWPAIVFLRNFRESRSGNHKSLGKGMGRLYTMQLESIRWLPLIGYY